MDNDNMIVRGNPPIYNGEGDYAFISYSHKDAPAVYEDLWWLHDSGFRFWYDDAIRAGEYWNEAVESRIKSEACKVVIFYVSKNSLGSEAVRREMNFVKANNKKFFTVMLEEGGIARILGQMLSDNTIKISEFSLYSHFFNEDILYIDRTVFSFADYAEKMAQQLNLYGLNVSASAIQGEPRVKKVLVLCKDSSFSNSIVSGIYDVLSSRENVILDKILIDKTLNRFEIPVAFHEAFSQNIEKYDAFILRVPNKYNDQILTSIRYAQSLGKKVILLDLEIPQDKLEEYGIEQTFIGSDFAAGGQLIGEKIKEIVARISVKESRVILFLGPYINNAARKRCDSLDETLGDSIPDHILHRYNLPSLNPSDAADSIREHASDWIANKTFENKTLILFCGIDNIAQEIMSIVARNEEEDLLFKALKMARKLILIGYDGIRGVNNEIVLKNYGIDFLTVDVVPSKQGANAAQMVFSQLFEGQGAGTVLTQPELIEHVKYSPKKYATAEAVAPFLKGKKVFIFDLDGTIAETESLHWEAYNELLAQYNVHLTDKDISRYIGHSEIQIYGMIKRDYGISFDDNVFLQERIDRYLHLTRKRKLKPFDFAMDLLKVPDVCKILVTSQIPPVVDNLLSYWGLADSFSFRYCCHDGQYTKKQIYSNINSFIGGYGPVKPDEVVLFEDSAHYIAEAKKLGISVIGVEHKYNQGKLNICDAILCQTPNIGLFAGLCGLDVVYYDTQDLPEENEKLRIRDFDLAIGGPAANAAITYAMMGGDAYLVTAIGDSAESRMIKEKLHSYHVHVIDIADSKSLSQCNISAIYVNTKRATRTIFSGQANIRQSRKIEFEEIAKKAKFVLYDGNMPVVENILIQYVDHYEKALIIDAGSYKQGFKDCFYRATAVISSEGFKDPQGQDVFELQKQYGFRYAAKTCGNNPIQYMDRGEVKTIAIPSVEAIDTLGAGDVFHGAFCYYYYAEGADFPCALKKAGDFAAYCVEVQGVVNGIIHAKAIQDNEMLEL